MNEQYTYMSEVYDSMIEMDYDKWKNFIENYFSKKEDLKNSECLELACGTGNMTLKLKEMGLNVTAMDISQDMLNIAEKKLRLSNYKVKFFVGDMKNINLNKKFNYIFSFCDGYNYIIEDNDIKEAFKSAYDSLSDSGCFIFDISTQHKLIDEIGNKSFTLNEDELCYIWDNYTEDDLVEMYITFFVKQGDMYKRFDEVHYQRAYSIAYIEKMLREVGFKSLEIFNDYENEVATDESLRAVFVARK